MWERSWTNLMMLSATIPSYKKDDEKPKEREGDLTDASSVWGSF